MIRPRRLLGILALAALAQTGIATAAQAHKASDAYLSLAVDGAGARGRWDIALRDLELAVGLDADGDGRITWGELRARRGAVDAYALSHLRVSAGADPCTTRVVSQQVDAHTDGAYAVLELAIACRNERALGLDYQLLFALDPQHRGLLRVEADGRVETAVLSPAHPHYALSAPGGAWRAFADFTREGVWHIWIGIDHILFLVCLLLPAVMRRVEGGWRPVQTGAEAARETLRVVTAFTASHSLTLALAALGHLSVPSQWVESAIAASVVIAALDNVWPFLRAPRWAVAFGFGLVHGLGFASVLSGLGLPGGSRAVSLIGFNLGVELGQLAIVAALLPLALWVRGSALYPRLALSGGSLAICGLAGVWLWERAIGA